MGRKSSLTPDQWAEVERRHLVDGTSINALAAEYGVNESSIRRRLKPSTAGAAARKQHPLHSLAEEKVRVEMESKRIAEQIAALPYTNQMIVSDLARKLTNISQHLGSAAEISAASAHRLSILANQQLELVDSIEPIKSMVQLQTMALLQKMANGASEIPMSLLRANKEVIEDMNKGDGGDPAKMNWAIEFVKPTSER